eukprot:823328-Karenia_brevis.AAC.1
MPEFKVFDVGNRCDKLNNPKFTVDLKNQILTKHPILVSSSSNQNAEIEDETFRKHCPVDV